MTQAQQILPPSSHNSGIAAYNGFRAQLSELAAHNASMVFQYETPKGNKEARSHIFKLRKTRAAVDDVRKKEKADSLEYGRRVDAEAKEISAQLDAMIDVHQRHLDEIDAREAARVAGIQARIEAMRVQGQELAGLSLPDIDMRVAVLNSVQIDVSFAELMAPAIQVRDVALFALNDARGLAVQREKDAQELERLRAEAQEKREQEIAAIAAENARKAAEKKAADDAEREKTRVAEEKAEAERRTQKALKEAAEREEALKREAQDAAARQAAAVNAERERLEREAQAAAYLENARARDKARQGEVHTAVSSALVTHAGLTPEQAKAVVIAIYKGQVSGLKLIY